MPTSKEAAAAVAATAATDALKGQAAVAAEQALLARQAAAAATQRAEFTYLAGIPANRRTVAQNNRLAVFMATAPMTQQAGPTALHALSTTVQVLEVPRGGTVYRLNDPSDGFYVVVDGRVALYDVKDREELEADDGMVERLARADCFGEEDLLSNSRRAHRADVTPESSAILLRVSPEMYRKYLQHLHQQDFEDKVSFLAQLEVFRTLPDETLRKLAPCFSQVELRAKEYLVRQGERADSMYAIASGQCSVLVDPNFRPETNGVAESDPKKAMQVCLIGPGNIVGDMTVLANVRKRTASILCLTDLIGYKIRRATFIRRVPPIQLEALRQVAEAKLRITERRLHSAAAGPGSSGGGAPVLLTLRDKILHGYDLRQLSAPTTAAPMELRTLGPRSLNGGVENLLSNSLAALAAANTSSSGVDGASGGHNASSAAPSVSYNGTPFGGAGPMSQAAAASVASMSNAAFGGWTGMGDARMRFSGPRRSPSINLHYGQALGSGTGGGGLGASSGLSGPMDRALAAAASASATAAAKTRSRTNGALTALSGGMRPQEINFTWGLGPGTLINSLLERPATATATNTRRTTQPDARSNSGGAGGEAAEANGISTIGLGGPTLSGPLPSSAAAQLQPTSARHNTQHLSFNYGRPGGILPAARPSSHALLTSFPRWTSGPADAPTASSADMPLSFSVVGVGVTAAVVAPSSAPSAASASGLPRASSRSMQRSGSVSAAAGERPASSLEPSPSRTSISSPTLRQSGVVPGGTAAAAGAEPESPYDSPRQPSPQRDGEGNTIRRARSRVGLAVDVALGASGADGAGSPGGREEGVSTTITPTASSKGSALSSPWKNQNDSAQQPDQGSEEADGEVSSPVSTGSPTRSRPLPRKQKSMGKARFSPKIVTENSSVDAMVVEAMVTALAKDVLLKQARAVEAALEAEAAAMGAKSAERIVESLEGEAAELEGQRGAEALAGSSTAGDGGTSEAGNCGNTAAAAAAGNEAGGEEQPEAETAAATPETSEEEEASLVDRNEADGEEVAAGWGGAESAAMKEGSTAGPMLPMLRQRSVSGPGNGIDREGSSAYVSGSGSAHPADGVAAESSSSVAPTATEGAAVMDARRPASAASRRASEPGRSLTAADGSSLTPVRSTAGSPVHGEGSTTSDAASIASRDNGLDRQPSLQRQPSQQLPPLQSQSQSLLLPSLSKGALVEPGSASGSLSGELSRVVSMTGTRRLSSVSANGGIVSAPNSFDREQSQQGVGGAAPASGGGTKTAPGAVVPMIAVPSPPLRPVSRQPATLQLVLPDTAGVGSARHSGVSPPRRALMGPAAPRPYPYVGPFLSMNKGLNLPPSFTNPHLTTLPKPPPSALGSMRGLERVAATERPEGKSGAATEFSTVVSGSASIGGGGGGGVGSGIASVGSTPGSRGQLRKGGALYKPATLPRAGVPPPAL